MLNGKTFLAIIPARGGSKRLIRKNVLNLHGKPLITWTIEAALESKYIDDVIVTSDDREILAVSKEAGADLIIRPSKLASDTASTFDAIEHALMNYGQYDYIVLLQATSPLRNSKHIDEAINLLAKKEADAIISVCKVDHNPLWSNSIPVDDSMHLFLEKQKKNIRSQDLPAYFRLNGAIYITNTRRLLDERTLFIESNIYAYKMSRTASIDIDEKIDLLLAKTILNDR